MIDGIEIFRYKKAETTIQEEFVRLDKMKIQTQSQPLLSSQEDVGAESNGHGDFSTTSSSSSSASSSSLSVSFSSSYPTLERGQISKEKDLDLESSVLVSGIRGSVDSHHSSVDINNNNNNTNNTHHNRTVKNVISSTKKKTKFSLNEKK